MEGWWGVCTMFDGVVLSQLTPGPQATSATSAGWVQVIKEEDSVDKKQSCMNNQPKHATRKVGNSANLSTRHTIQD